MQDCILVVHPFRRAFPKHHMLPALGPAEEGCGRVGGKGYALRQTVLPGEIALAHCIPSSHMSLLLEGFIAWTPKDLFSIYGDKN